MSRPARSRSAGVRSCPRIASASHTRLIAIVIVLFGAPAITPAQTRAFLDAPAVKTRIRVQWDAGYRVFKYAVDDDDKFVTLEPEALFLTKTSVYVTYPRINPLVMQATAAISTASDPAHGTIAQLLEAMMNVVSLVRGTAEPDVSLLASPPRAPITCPAVVEARAQVATLDRSLFGPATSPSAVRTAVGSWSETIAAGYHAGKSGPSAISDGAARIDEFVDSIAALIEHAGDAVRFIEAKAASVEAPATDCAALASAIYHLAHLSNPRVRLDQLSALRSAARQLGDTLQRDYLDHPELKWLGSDFIVSKEITPTPSRMRVIEVKAVGLSFSVDGLTSALVVRRGDAGSASFVVRRYSVLTTEIGVGVVVGFVPQPKYGTSTNASGHTIVAKVPTDPVSVDPSIVVNFVCRCESGPFVAPMLQVGVSTSKDVPAILAGGGLRLFGIGKGDLAIGGGLMFAWVRDLRTLRPNDEVTGTRDIEADLGLTRVWPPRGYFSLQYKF